MLYQSRLVVFGSAYTKLRTAGLPVSAKLSFEPRKIGLNRTLKNHLKYFDFGLSSFKHHTLLSLAFPLQSYQDPAHLSSHAL